MQTPMCDTRSHLCDNRALPWTGTAKKKKPDHFFDRVMIFYADVWLGSGRLEPAVHRTAMNPDPFGEGFNGAALLQVNFDHLFALCRQVKLRRAWDATGVDEVQL